MGNVFSNNNDNNKQQICRSGLTRNIFRLAFFVARLGHFKTHISFAGPSPARWKNHLSFGPACWKNHLSSASPARPGPRAGQGTGFGLGPGPCSSLNYVHPNFCTSNDNLFFNLKSYFLTTIVSMGLRQQIKHKNYLAKRAEIFHGLIWNYQKSIYVQISASQNAQFLK